MQCGDGCWTTYFICDRQSPQGYVSECTGENIFVVRDGTIITPPVSAGALEGITQSSVATIARDLGFEYREGNILRSDLYTADEAFLSGTAAEVVELLGDLQLVVDGEGQALLLAAVPQRRVVDVDGVGHLRHPGQVVVVPGVGAGPVDVAAGSVAVGAGPAAPRHARP